MISAAGFMRLKHSGGRLLPYTQRKIFGIEDIGHCDWVDGRSIVACGVRVGIRTNKPEFLEKLLAMIPEIWKPSAARVVERLFSLRVGTSGLRRNGRSWHQLYEDQQIVASSPDLDWVLETFERQLKMYLAEMAQRRVFVHAGAVGWRGKAIIVPGRSMSGKTSLVAELVRAGATYYSDEYAVLDKYGRVHPYSAPLSIREDETLKQKKCEVEEFGGSAGVYPLPVGLVVVSYYKPAAHWRPRALSAGEGMLELLANTVPARRKPKVVVPTLEKAIRAAVALKGARGEAQETAPLILRTMDRNARDGSG